MNFRTTATEKLTNNIHKVTNRQTFHSISQTDTQQIYIPIQTYYTDTETQRLSHTLTLSDIHSYTLRYTHSLSHTVRQTHIDSSVRHSHTHSHTLTLSYIQSYTLTYTPSQPHTVRHTHIYTPQSHTLRCSPQSHTVTHTHTQTHIQGVSKP